MISDAIPKISISISDSYASSSSLSSTASSSSSGSSSMSTLSMSGDTDPYPEAIIQGFNKSYLYSNEHEKQKIIKEIARRIAKIYAHFLTPEAVKERGIIGLIFSQVPTSYPDLSVVKKFQEMLEKRIIFSMSRVNRCLTTLCVNYLPEGLLEDVLQEFSLIYHQKNYPYYFPRYSHVSFWTFHEGAIKIRMFSRDIRLLTAK